MKKVAIAACIVSITILLLPGLAKAQHTFRTTPSGSIIGYLEYLPPDYHSNSNKYPVVIFLHGVKERGANSTDPATLKTTINLVTALGPPAHVKAGASMPFILITPQLKNSYSSWPSSYIKEVLDYCKTYLRIDERRIHITGLSMGGHGAWTCIQDMPTTYASAFPVCGAHNSPSLACGIARENVAVWAVHGDSDPVVSHTKSVNMVNAINACTPAPNPLAKISIYANVAHNAWNRGYALDNTYHNPNFYQWVMQQTKGRKAGNYIPLANAGGDKSISLPTNSVVISGTATDNGGSIASYKWAQLQGPSTATLSNATSASVTASNLVAGTYIFKFTVTDNGGVIDSDFVKVTVSGSGTNAPPIVNAGSDKTLHLPTNAATIAATATDPDGISTYSWSKISGGNATLSGNTSSTLSVSSMAVGSYVFRVTVKDSKGASSSDDVSVVVNNPPTVSAGADATINLPTNSIAIQGSASDTDGSISKYAWTKTSGSSATLSGATTSKLTASGLVAGSYIFRLTVTDNRGATKYDEVKVTVNSSTTNATPVANAGADKVIHLPTTSVSFTGSGKDTDGSITSYSWIKLSGGNATLSGASSATLSVTGLAAGAYVFRLKVTDDKGAINVDDVNLFVNSVPNVYAGLDQVITLPSSAATFASTVTDADGSIKSYSWQKLTGGNAVLTGATTSTLSVSGLVAGSYIFRVTVSDDRGATDIDDVNLFVNTAPTVNAGTDFSITLPTNTTSIQGSAADPDGTISTYAWSMLSGPGATLSGATTSKLTASKLLAGSYVFRLTVTDNRGAKKYDDIKLTVNSSSSGSTIPNSVPVANAGPDRVVTLPINLLTLTGGGTDTDGTIASYSWVKLTGGTATLSGANTNKLSASGLSAGAYKFRLTVTDDDGATDIDDVDVFVNVPPTVSLGSDLTITLPTNYVSIQGTAADNDGTISSYEWRMITGTFATLSNTTTSRLSVTGLVEGSYVFRLIVKDNHGATQRDDIKVQVLGGTGNAAPIANAGSDKVITLPTSSVTLTGSATDSDGSIAKYVWTQLLGNAATLSGTNTNQLQVSGLLAGNYKFRLLVVDNKGRTGIDDVSVVVNAATSGAAFADGTEIIDDAILAAEPSQMELSFHDGEYWKNKHVVIYDASGKQIFKGRWSADLYSTIIEPGKLFIYNVIDEDRRVKQGKVFVTR